MSNSKEYLYILYGYFITLCNIIFQTPLQLAIKLGYADIVQELLLRGASPLITDTKVNTATLKNYFLKTFGLFDVKKLHSINIGSRE